MIYSESYWSDIKKVICNIPNVERLYLKKILITGATGMLGSSVAEILFYLNREFDANIDIYLAGRSEEKMNQRFYLFRKEYTFIKYDATEIPSINIIPDYIIHGASNANPAIYTKQPVETMLGNFIGLNALLHIAVETKCKRVLYISSSEVYGNKTNNEPYIEKIGRASCRERVSHQV